MKSYEGLHISLTIQLIDPTDYHSPAQQAQHAKQNGLEIRQRIVKREGCIVLCETLH